MDGVAEVYEDGGYTGGNLNRPSLSRLLSAVEQGLVDVIVIYKLDRLTRSLSDFIRLIDLLDQYEVTFVSVTQAFDTQDSMGRLVLNILLTFAQFEREMLADRIRDKAHALRRAGRWIGGAAPYGYDLVDHRLVLNRQEAAVVRLVHARYLELRSSNQVVCEMRTAGMLSKAWINRRGEQCGGRAITQSVIYGMLGNPLYLGEFHVEGEVIKALHQPIVDRGVWQEVRDLKESRRLKKPPDRPQEHLLLGFTFDDLGRKMVVAAGVRKGSAYRYYTSTPNHRLSRSGTKALRAGATDLEELVRAAVATFLRDRPQVSQAVRALGHRDEDTDRLIAAARRRPGGSRPSTGGASGGHGRR
jgi:site-specific DNA recombinase